MCVYINMKHIKKIHLTCKDKKNINNDIWIKCLYYYKKLYPDYDIIIYDNQDIYNIIRQYYPQYLDKVKQIKTGAILADIFRYLILYLEGGIYSDMDCMPLKRVDELYNKDFKYYHGDKNRDNNYWIYKNRNDIQNKKWDFDHNICNNCNTITDSNVITHSNVITMRCNGHTIGDNTSVLLSYEFHNDWLNINEIINTEVSVSSLFKDAIKKYKLQICKWFMISEPKQEIFLKMFLYCMKGLDILIHLKPTDKNYKHIVINLTGPSGFTKIVMENMSSKIKILPSDFFCTGSWNNTIPITRNSYVKHLYTSSWH